MKYIILLALVAVILAGTALAKGPKGQDSYGQPVDNFMPSSFGSVTTTKAVKTIDTTTAHAVEYKTSAICNVTINGAGDSWPTVANSPERQYIPGGVTSLVFTCASSAGSTLSYKLQ